MFYFLEKKKKTSIWKIIAIIAGIAAVAAAGVAAFMLWEKKIGAEKKIEQEISAIIEEKFSEQELCDEACEE